MGSDDIKSNEKSGQGAKKHLTVSDKGTNVMERSSVLKKKMESYQKLTQKDIMDFMYLSILALYFFRAFFDTTLFHLPWPDWYFDFLRLLLIGYAVFKIKVNHSDSIRIAVRDVILLACLILVYRSTGYLFLVELGLLIFAAKDVPYRKILKLYFYIGLFVVGIAVLASLSGCIKDIIYYDPPRYKHTFGIVHTTDFGAHIVYLILSYLVLKDKKPGYIITVLSLLAAYILYKYSGTRCSSGCLVLLAVGTAYLNLSKGDFFDSLLVYAVPGFPIGALFFTLIYNENNHILQKANQILSGRLYWGKAAFEKYGMSLWGTPFDMIGAGGDAVFRTGYNFVDSSYVMIFIRYGAVLLILVTIGFLWLSIRAKASGYRNLILAIFIMLVHCTIEHHMLELAYNPLILIFFADLADRVLPIPESDGIKKNKASIILRCALAGLGILLLLFNRSRLSSYLRTFVTLLQLNKPERNIYFILLVLTGSTVIIVTGYLLWKVFQGFLKKENKRLISGNLITAVCLMVLIIAGAAIGNHEMQARALEYQEAVASGKKIIEELEKSAEFDLFIDDIPFLYIQNKGKMKSRVLPGNPYGKESENVVFITDLKREQNKLIDNGYLCGKISDKEYLYTNVAEVEKVIQKMGIELNHYYGETQELDLLKLAEQNGLEVLGHRVMIEGPEKSLIHGPWVTVYRGRIKVDYDLNLLETELGDEEEIARLRLSSDSGAQIIKEVGIKKSDFDENGHYIASIISDIPDSENVEFLLFANGNTRLSLNALSYVKIPIE